MKTMYEYLIDVKRKLNIPSDNKLSEFLGLTRASIAMIKSGGSVSDATALKIAEALEIEYEEVLLAATAQRSNNPVIRKAWENISKRSGIAAGVFISGSLSANGLEALLWIIQEAGNKGILYIM
jgi:transcriptional regulator with XRE-family HTH domain